MNKSEGVKNCPTRLLPLLPRREYVFSVFESQRDCVLDPRGLRANEPSWEKACRSCRFLHPERMEITQPRVARNELPWVGGPLNLNPERVLSKTLKRYGAEGR